MARLTIITEPDPLLRKTSKPVTEFSARLHELLDDMSETMNHHGQGIGIAAVQVGVLYRAAILLTDQYKQIEIINPTIVSATRNKSGSEGCLSTPGVYGRVKRPQMLTLKFLDRHGKENTIDLYGRDAVVASHEIDHMDGILFTDRMTK